MACLIVTSHLLTIAVAFGQGGAPVIEDLGVPIRAIVFGNSQAVFAPSPAGREEMLYIPYYSTTGSALVGHHWESGEHVEAKLGSSGGYGCCRGTDGAIYVGGVGPGNLYRYDPTSGEVRNLGGAQYGADYIWSAAASGEGKVYGACYPKANVIEYDIATGALRDLGAMVEGRQYCRSIAVDSQGKVWVGVGIPAHLIRLDPATGERQDLLPEDLRGNSICYDLAASGDRVFVSVLYDGAALVYDALTGELTHRIPRPEGDDLWMTCAGAAPGDLYLCAQPSGTLYLYRDATREVTKVHDDLGQCLRVVEARWVHGIDDQDYFVYDLQEGRYLHRERLTEAQSGMEVYTLAAGRDGCIYGSTYINQHMFRYDPSDGALADLGKVIRAGGQVDSMSGGADGRLYMGSYVRAVVSVYDPSRPWAPGTEAEANPRDLGQLGEGQYRTRSIALGPKGMIYVGSIPSYASAPVGAFSRVDPATGEKHVWTDLLPGGAAEAVVADERYVYAAGGGKLIVFDPETESKRAELSLAATALAVAPRGEVVCSVGGEVVLFSPGAMAVTASAPTGAGHLDTLAVGASGRVFGINGSAIVEIKTDPLSVMQVAGEGGRFLAVDRSDRLYFARGAHLYRCTLP